MRTITQETGAALMAQWLATGGAIDAAARQESGRDDGLTACEPSFSRMCFVEDGLTATGTPTAQVWCHVDDGLKASGPTQSWQRCF